MNTVGSVSCHRWNPGPKYVPGISPQKTRGGGGITSPPPVKAVWIVSVQLATRPTPSFIRGSFVSILVFKQACSLSTLCPGYVYCQLDAAFYCTIIRSADSKEGVVYLTARLSDRTGIQGVTCHVCIRTKFCSLKQPDMPLAVDVWSHMREQGVQPLEQDYMLMIKGWAQSKQLWDRVRDDSVERLLRELSDSAFELSPTDHVEPGDKRVMKGVGKRQP